VKVGFSRSGSFLTNLRGIFLIPKKKDLAKREITINSIDKNVFAFSMCVFE